MHESAMSLMALAELKNIGFVEVPPSGITPDIYDDLTLCGFSIGRSDAIWIDGWRVYKYVHPIDEHKKTEMRRYDRLMKKNKRKKSR